MRSILFLVKLISLTILNACGVARKRTLIQTLGECKVYRVSHGNAHHFRLTSFGCFASQSGSSIYVVDTQIGPADLTALLAHEYTHYLQRKEVGSWRFSWLYTTNPQFRLEAEMEAYRSQLETLCLEYAKTGMHITPVKARKVAAHFVTEIAVTSRTAYGLELEARTVANTYFKEFFDGEEFLDEYFA